MLELLDRRDAQKAARLFEGWQDTMIWPCLDGTMGEIYADETLESAVALVGDFAFCAGNAHGGAAQLFALRGFVIALPGSKSWERLLAGTAGAKRVTRYAFRKDGDVFDRELLRRAQPPEGYSLCAIDRELYNSCRAESWSRDLVSQFESYERYSALGLGVAAVKDGAVVAGASSYTAYRGGIEIEVDTKPEHRRRGLARACAARLMLECLERGLYPSWDAQNPASAALAIELG